jgi:hypothetical protein
MYNYGVKSKSIFQQAFIIIITKSKEAGAMAKKTNKPKNYREPVEKHDTASWANIESLEPVTRVHRPSESEVDNSKKYVDSNEK